MAAPTDAAPMTSELSGHVATWAGDGTWTVSFLRGRLLNEEQAHAALAAAAAAEVIRTSAAKLGLAPLEAVGLALMPAPRPPEVPQPRNVAFGGVFKRPRW